MGYDDYTFRWTKERVIEQCQILTSNSTMEMRKFTDWELDSLGKIKIMAIRS